MPVQPPQPPKQAAYTQPSNPVSDTPQEQHLQTEPSRHYGDPIPSIKRTAKSNPSSDEARAQLAKEHEIERRSMQNASDVDLEYGVEQQPAEGYIADSVRYKGMGARRAQAGAHAGPVGSAAGPEHPGFGGEDDLAANMDRKRENHDKILDEKMEFDRDDSNREVFEREAVRQQRLRRNEDIDVQQAVKDVTGDPVVGDHGDHE